MSICVHKLGKGCLRCYPKDLKKEKKIKKLYSKIENDYNVIESRLEILVNRTKRYNKLIHNYGGVVDGVSSSNNFEPSNPLDKSSTTIHHAKKNLASNFMEVKIAYGIYNWFMINEVVKWRKHFKGVRYY